MSKMHMELHVDVDPDTGECAIELQARGYGDAVALIYAALHDAGHQYERSIDRILSDLSDVHERAKVKPVINNYPHSETVELFDADGNLIN